MFLSKHVQHICVHIPLIVLCTEAYACLLSMCRSTTVIASVLEFDHNFRLRSCCRQENCLRDLNQVRLVKHANLPKL